MDVSLLQQLSYVVAALGVCVAAIYYIMVLRAAEKNRRIQLVSQLSRDLNTAEGMRTHFELLNMEWGDYDEFEKKYGSDTNIEACSLRYNVWTIYNNLGYMLRMGMIDAEDLWTLSGIGSIYQWAKWESVIQEQRMRYNGKNWMKDFEYMVSVMLKIQMREDPSFKVPETYARYIPDK